MTRLSEDEFKATFNPPMRRLSLEDAPPFDFFPYVDTIPVADFGGHVCRGDVSHVWEDASATFQHVLFGMQDPNVFMVILLDVRAMTVMGHILLDLNRLYGLNES